MTRFFHQNQADQERPEEMNAWGSCEAVHIGYSSSDVIIRASFNAPTFNIQLLHLNSCFGMKLLYGVNKAVIMNFLDYT